MNQTTKHGSGSAQLGPASGFAFVRGRLLAPEGDGGAAGGSTGGEAATTASTTQPSTAATTTQGDSGTAPGGSGEKLLPQSQVNALVAAARREGKEQAQRDAQQVTQQQAKKPEPSKSSDPSDRLAALEAELAETRQRSVFDKHAARLGLSDDLSEDLFELSKSQRPENVGEWLASKAERFNLKPAPAPSTASAATTPTAAPSEPAKPPAAAPSAPSKVDPLTGSGLVDIWNLSEAQLVQLGPAGVRAEFEKILGVARQQQGAPPRPKLPQR